MGRFVSYILRCLCGEEEEKQSTPLPPPPTTTDGDHLRSPLLRSQISDNGRRQGLFFVLEQRSESSKPFVLSRAGSNNNLKLASSAPAPAAKVVPSVQAGHQVLKLKEKALQLPTKLREKGSSVVVGKSLNTAVNEVWKKHYCSNQRILLVGEGDFSFSSSLAFVFGSAVNIVATSLDSQEFLYKNYKRAMTNIAGLWARGCLVINELDATKMAGHDSLKGMKFDRIVFNFPHAGFYPKESAVVQIRRHKKLIRMFMENAKKLMKEDGGEVHITHKTNGFHSQWDLEGSASGAGLKLVGRPEKFNFIEYPGYNTKYGFGGDKNFNCNPSSTFMFGVP